MLEYLGYDILQKILCQLEQSDCLNLSRCCKSLYNLVIPRLYSVISIDSTKRFFTYTEMGLNTTQIPTAFGTKNSYFVKKVNIKSIYCLNSFLKQLKSHPEYCKFVRVLQFEGKIPDIPELKLIEDLYLIFPHLENLISFKWLNNEYDLDIELINILPNFNKLLEFGGNFKFDKETIDFPVNEIREFNLSNFMFSDKLTNINIDKFTKLEKLSLARFNNTSTALSNLELLSTGISDLENSNYLQNFFNISLKNKMDLSELTLKNLLITASDANILIKNINLNNMTTLRIIDCNEAFYDRNFRLYRRNSPEKFFLETIGSHLTNIKYLELGLNNELNYNYSTINFIESLPKILLKLSIDIKFNRSENLTFNLNNLLGSIAQHKKLHYLYLDFKVMNTNNNVNLSDFSYDIQVLEKLYKIESLQFLGFSINNYQFASFLHIIRNFTKLKILQLNIFDGYKTINDSRSNSLIDKEYLEYSNYFLRIVEADQCSKFAKDSYSILTELNWICLKLTDYKVYQCINDDVILSVGSEEYFNDIVDIIIPC